MSSNRGKRKLIRIHYKTLDTALLRPLPADLAPWICCYFPAETVFPILLLDTVGICSIDFDIQLQKSWFMRSTGKLATAYLCIKSLKKNWHCKLQWCLPLTCLPNSVIFFVVLRVPNPKCSSIFTPSSPQSSQFDSNPHVHRPREWNNFAPRNPPNVP